MQYSRINKCSLYTVCSVAMLGMAITFSNVAFAKEDTACKLKYWSAKSIIKESAIKRPKLGIVVADPAFKSCLRRVTDHTKLNQQISGHTYSQLQAWNADQTMILLMTNQIIDAKTFKLLHTIMGDTDGVRWSTTDPMQIFYTGGSVSGKFKGERCKQSDARLMSYRLTRKGDRVKGKHEIAFCFPEYKDLAKDPSYEDISSNGRYVALVGERKLDNRYELFAVDIIDKIKYKTLLLPVHKKWGPLYPDWAAVTPSGRYVLAQWGNGKDRFYGLEAYDLKTMRYAGKVSTSSGHGDIAIDKKGREYFIQTNASNAYLLGDRHYLIKARIPNGIFLNKAGADESRTLKSGATIPLLVLDWFHSIHISCRNHKYPGFCVVTTTGGYKNGRQALEREIFLLDLGSRANKPRVKRLVHHRSNSLTIEKSCGIEPYWADPHATISPDGRKVMFRSSWGKRCYIESYIVTWR
jgi:hypothetical protein